MNTKRYLVILQGQGDTDIKLVTQETWDWIDSPYTGKAEVIPETKTKMTPTSGSYDNDRALRASGVPFERTRDAYKWALENSVEIVDEYIGYIY